MAIRVPGSGLYVYVRRLQMEHVTSRCPHGEFGVRLRFRV